MFFFRLPKAITEIRRNENSWCIFLYYGLPKPYHLALVSAGKHDIFYRQCRLYQNQLIPSHKHEILSIVQGQQWISWYKCDRAWLCACSVDNPLAKAWGLSLRTGAQTMLYLSLLMRKMFVTENLIGCSESCWHAVKRRSGKFDLRTGRRPRSGPRTLGMQSWYKIWNTRVVQTVLRKVSR